MEIWCPIMGTDENNHLGGGGVLAMQLYVSMFICVCIHMHVHWCAGTCVCMHVCVWVHVCSVFMYTCTLQSWVGPCCWVHCPTTPELCQKKWTMYSLCIFKNWPFLMYFIFSSFVEHLFIVFSFNFQLLGGEEWDITFFLILRASSFLPSLPSSVCLFLSFFPSFLPACLSVPLLLSNLLLFYGKNIILWHYMLMYLPFPPLSLCSTVNFCYFSLGQLLIQQIFIEHLLCAATVLALGVYQCAFFKCLVSLGVMFNFVSKKEAVISLAGSPCTWVGIVHWSLLLWNEQVGSQLDLLGGGEGKAIICMLLSGLLTTTSGTQVLFWFVQILYNFTPLYLEKTGLATEIPVCLHCLWVMAWL